MSDTPRLDAGSDLPAKTVQQLMVTRVRQHKYTRFDEFVPLRNQYALIKNLPIPGIIHPLNLELLRVGESRTGL